jgi:Raf kinase inhibitor-like YbhB/YbcL family protein
MKTLTIISITIIGFLVVASFASAQDWEDHQFRVTSTTFENGATLPISTIDNFPVNGSNVCSVDGSPGGNESPELSWTNAPRHTQSFVVSTFDVTAGVTHWGMYNISATTTELPENAGVAGSSYGQQVQNVFFDLSYDGPCPPAGIAPLAHRYVFTVYALDTELHLPSFKNFPATALALYRSLVAAGRYHHILASASITGFYSTTPPSN